MKATHRLRLAPTGHRCGLFFAEGEGASLTVFVLPKPWAQGEGALLAGGCVVCKTDDQLLIVGVEGSGASVAASAPLGRLLNGVSAQINDDPARLKKTGITEQDQEEADEEAADPGLGALLRVERSGQAETPNDPNAPTLDDLMRTGLSALIRLAGQADQEGAWTSRPSTDAAEHENAEAGGAVSPHRSASGADPLMLLAQWRLVELIGAHLRQLRRGYVPVEEEAPVIRGRMTQRGLLQAAARLGPRIECAHDEFTDTTPLFRVLVTALDRVASGAIAEAHGLAGWSVMAQVRARAVHLRRQLHQLPSLPWAQAAAEASRLSRRPLPRALRIWQPALQLARAILRDESVRPVASDDGVVAQHWWLNTSKLWEGILKQACGRAGWSVNVEAKGDCTPWVGLGNAKQPDLLLSRSGGAPGRVVADAKYKLLGPKGLWAADQYQLFAYSHTARWGEQAADAAAVLYLSTAPRHEHFPRGDDPNFKLHLIGLPFPRHDQLEPASWTAYLSEAAQALGPLAQPPDPPAD
jgi:hypothetical protein